MILIDAPYISSGGGLRLLEYLVDELLKREVDFYLISDDRCKGMFDHLAHVDYIPQSLRVRNAWYRKHDLSGFTSVLCFGNIPTPVKMNVPVYTYFHNINLLTLEGFPTLKEKAKAWLKRQVYRHYRRNTDFWLVQTENTRTELIRHLHEWPDRVKLMPFYEIPESYRGASHGEDYVYVADYLRPKQHRELLDAWLLLHDRGIDRTLHLTVPDRALEILAKIDAVTRLGARVVNHGFLPFQEMAGLYAGAKAIVYPSVNESFGLGIVEALEAGCDVIGAARPYVYAICKPSGVFDPYSPESIASAVEWYERGIRPKSSLLVHNQIDELIDLLCGTGNV